MGLTTTVRSTVKTELTATQGESTPTDTLEETNSFNWADGTGADQADVEWHDTRTLAGSASETLDLAGSLTNGLGQTATFAKVCLLEIVNQGTNAADILNVGGAASNAWESWVGLAGSIFKVGPEGRFYMDNPSAAAFAVTAGTGDQLKIENVGGNTLTYRIRIVGRSA